MVENIVVSYRFIGNLNFYYLVRTKMNAVRKLKTTLLTIICALLTAGVHPEQAANEPPLTRGTSLFWKNATVYFLLTDRFCNGDPDNDFSLGRKQDGAPLRSFAGGDLQGLTAKIEDGYFDRLGVDALWMTPVVEQIRGFTDEGTGKTYAYHGYWTRDWTAIDPNFGTEADFAAMVKAAHQRGIRVLMDVVINHTGPVTAADGQWPDEWVRTAPRCQYQDYRSTVECTLVENLPDIRTESDVPVDLPPFLEKKWQAEGRHDKEIQSLDAFFARTGYPRAPRYYIVKWLRDWVRKYGLDGFRVDTVKHTEAGIWAELKKECSQAFEEWKAAHPQQKLDDEAFFMVGEVYGYESGHGREYQYGDRGVDFFANGFESLINFAFKTDAALSPEELFAKYDRNLNGEQLQEQGVLNYISSHDDSNPFDLTRERSFEAATKLMLCPGGVQIYYGDETGRSLKVDGVNGDANLRSSMNWEAAERDNATKDLLVHWQKLGNFRQRHPAVGAGRHQILQEAPYLFKRSLRHGDANEEVLVGLELPTGLKEFSAFDVFEDGDQLKDYYSGQLTTVHSGKITLDTPYGITLLGKVD